MPLKVEDAHTAWAGVENHVDDPEELRVMYSAADSFQQYAKTAHYQITHMRRNAFYALPQSQRSILNSPPINYLDTLTKVDEAIQSNAKLARAIFSTSLSTFGLGVEVEDGSGKLQMPNQWDGRAKHNDIDKARSTLRQFFRDWSEGGKIEREICYAPVKRAVAAEKKKFKTTTEDQRLKVLIPGAGLGRLVFDLFLDGCDTEGNEISYHQLLASSYILNCVERKEQFEIFPWVHTFSNHLTRENQLRSYLVPDVHCATETARVQQETGELGEMSMTAADFLCEYNKPDNKDRFDVVATVFFLDTAPNLMRYLEAIMHCLKPGGILVNIGPLLWHFEGQVPRHMHDDGGDTESECNMTGITEPGSFELTDDEVISLVEKMGFVVESRETGIEAPYIHDAQSMLQSMYKASSWVARKPTVVKSE
ncbi:N2227-like protein-domain-containing protein [Podospora fimiseda]|uniref:carnosine N-methyltransferase n=1 Tax=Podospora fimiseda TaxID=252190 RepID=A0AAN7BPD5_9PEZI|nr:N2227-like protein-domain-containing protein [Podospora fimiseda]